MRLGIMYKSGDIILAQIQFTDTFEIKKRPSVVLFEEFGNFIVAGITSNLRMEGIPLSKDEGVIKESIIKCNYIFTLSNKMIIKKLFSLSIEKKRLLYDELIKHLSDLNN
jgi:mRNA interferase MazF